MEKNKKKNVRMCINFTIQQRLAQHCKSAMFQLKTKEEDLVPKYIV